MAKRSKVFLIDEDPVFALVAAGVFRAAGAIEVNHISNTTSEIGAVVVGAEPQDLIVLGLNMSGLDGLAIMRLLSEQKYPGFVAVSSAESSSIRDSAVRLIGLFGLKSAGELCRPLREADVRNLLAVSAQSVFTPLPMTANLNKSPWHLCPVYQPKLDSLTGEIVGGEALMRLKTADGHLLPPFAHIEKVTQEGRLASETLKFLDLILADMAGFRAAGYFPVISVNVPAPVAEEPGFPATFAAKVRACGISPSQITIELTESALPADIASLVEVLTRLRMAGFGLALDDFGTGMANFDLLRMLPFNELKIDRSLAQTAEHDPLSAGVIETCATISRELGMILVAEGVESELQEKALKRLGVTVFQGFLFGKGIPAQEFLSSLRSDSEVSSRYIGNT